MALVLLVELLVEIVVQRCQHLLTGLVEISDFRSVHFLEACNLMLPLLGQLDPHFFKLLPMPRPQRVEFVIVALLI